MHDHFTTILLPFYYLSHRREIKVSFLFLSWAIFLPQAYKARLKVDSPKLAYKSRDKKSGAYHTLPFMALTGQTGFRQLKMIADMAAPFVPKSVRAEKSVPKIFLIIPRKTTQQLAHST